MKRTKRFAVTMLRLKHLGLIISLTVVSVFAEDCLVETPYGTIKGVLETNNVDGSKFCAYRGIPYAKALTEETKFRDCEPVEPWGDKVLDASSYGNSCPCFDIILREFMGDVNCLFINIYVPKNVPEGELLPAMIFLHGGAFLFGNGDDMFYGPDHLIKENVVLATLNYRLGPLGFLNAQTASCPGNMGLKDQNRAFKFFKEIATSVGANPDEVTLFGESAGAASTELHLLSPMSKGLFKRVIMESGNAPASWAYGTEPNTGVDAIKEAMNLSGNTPEEIADELTKIPAMDIIKAFYGGLEDGSMDSLAALKFYPNKESEIDGVEQFLPRHPAEILAAGDFDTSIQILTGVNSDEAAMFYGEVKRGFDAQEDKDPNQFVDTLPKEVTENCKEPGNLPAKFFEKYTGSPTIGGTETEITMMVSDIIFNFAFWSSINFYRLHGAEVYSYYFQYRTIGGIVKDILGISEETCMHSEELGYIFYMMILDNVYDEGTPAHTLNKFFTSTWANFAKTGNPTPEGSGLVTWTPYSKSMSLMTIDLEPAMVPIKEIERNFNDRMCWMKSLLLDDLQALLEPFGLC